MLIALTPAILAAYRRWGIAVPAVMALGAAAVDAGAVDAHVHIVGYANYLLVWGSMYVWGFAWRDGSLTCPRWRPYALAATGAAALAALTAWGPFPVDMIGAGEPVGNTTPPSIALLAYAAAQTGLVLAAAPAVSRLLAQPRWWRPVDRLNPGVMLVYLWHMVPVIIVAVAFYPTGVMPQPRIGSAGWWELRLAWIALLAVILVPLIAGLLWVHRPLLRVLPDGLGSGRSRSSAMLLAGLAAAGFGLAKLAIVGFAPGGGAPDLALAACAGGLVLTLLSGPPSPGHGPRPQPPGAAPLRAGPSPRVVRLSGRCRRQDRTTTSGQPACITPIIRSARPTCPPCATNSTRNTARKPIMIPAATAATVGRSPQGTDSPRRQAPSGHITRAAKPTPAQHACASEPPACSGLAATSTPARPAAIRMSRPGAAAGRSASPVTTSQAPATANASVITHRSAAPIAASALTVPATALNGCGCRAAAIVHPATSSSGAVKAETTPHHGTPGPSLPPALSGAAGALPPSVAPLASLIGPPFICFMASTSFTMALPGFPTTGTVVPAGVPTSRLTTMCVANRPTGRFHLPFDIGFFSLSPEQKAAGDLQRDL